MWSRWADETPHFCGTFVWSNYSHLTGKISQKVAEEGNSPPLFQGKLDWWNIIIISYQIRSFPVWGYNICGNCRSFYWHFLARNASHRGEGGRPLQLCSTETAAVFSRRWCWVSWSNSWRDFTRKGSWWRKIHGKSSYFQGCPGWWNHIIWPEKIRMIFGHVFLPFWFIWTEIAIYLFKAFYGPIGSKSKIFCTSSFNT